MKSRRWVDTHYRLFLPNRKLFSLENNHLDSYTTFIIRIHKPLTDLYQDNYEDAINQSFAGRLS